MAIDQNPFFMLCSDFCGHSKISKPAQIHSEFLVGLGGIASKMSSTEGIPPIFLDDNLENVKAKITRCFSGGKDTKKEHLELGADLTIDVPYQWLLIFLEDDSELEQIALNYGPPKNGNIRMMTSDVKKIMFNVVMDYLLKHQERKALVTEEVLDHFFNPNRTFDLSRPSSEPIELASDEEYAKQGSNFDRYFKLYTESL